MVFYRQRERDQLQAELSEKNFQTSKKIHTLLQQLIATKAVSEQVVEEFISEHVPFKIFINSF